MTFFLSIIRLWILVRVVKNKMISNPEAWVTLGVRYASFDWARDQPPTLPSSKPLGTKEAKIKMTAIVV